MADPKVTFLFLVAGFEYSKKQLDFDLACTARVRERIAFLNNTLKAKDALVTVDTTLRFLRFNVGTGKVEVIDKSFIAGKGVASKLVRETDWQPLSSIGTGGANDPATFVSSGPFRQIDRNTDYTNVAAEYPDFDQGTPKPDVMSITDIYESVRQAPSGSVLELSFFGHAWIGGPILVNSTDHVNDPNNRDPTDKDGRATVDFNLIMGVPTPAVLALKHLIDFVASFDPNGFMHNWGCDIDVELRIVQQTITAKVKAKSPLTDSTMINFELEDNSRYRVVDPAATFFPADLKKTFSRTFGQVKKFLRQRLKASYAFQFAANCERTGLGALPGTEGDPEQSGFRLMKVCAKFDPPECPVGFAALFDFFRKEIGIQVNDRGYGIFDKATMTKLLADIAADGP
jgi:hypothetical protein